MHQAQWSPERPLPPPVSLASQSHHEKPPEVTCTSRGNPGFPASTRESPRETFFNTSRGQIPLPWLGSNDALPLATRMETRLPWRPTRGSLTSPSYLVRNRTLGPPLESNHEIPVAIREQSGVLRFHSRGMPVSPGASGMQPRDPCRPWRGTLASGHKPRCGLLALQSLESNPQLSFATRMEDWTCLGQHKRQPEFPVVTRESRRNSRKTTWLPRHRKMKPFPATAPQEKSHVRNWRSKGHLAPLMRPTKFPEIPVSLERNTEVFRHPLL